MAGLFGDVQWQGWPGPGSIQREFFEANPNAGYQRLLEQLGFGAFNLRPQAKWAQGLRPEAEQTYLGMLGGAPNPADYSYVDFLDQYWQPKLQTGWGELTAQQQGQRYPGGVGRGRWVGWAS